MTHERSLKCQRVNTSTWLRHISQFIALSTNKMNLNISKNKDEKKSLHEATPLLMINLLRSSASRCISVRTVMSYHGKHIVHLFYQMWKLFSLMRNFSPHQPLFLGLLSTMFPARMRVKRMMNRTPFRISSNLNTIFLYFISDQSANLRHICRELFSSLDLQHSISCLQNEMSVKYSKHSIKGHTRTWILSAASMGNKDVKRAPPLEYNIFTLARIRQPSWHLITRDSTGPSAGYCTRVITTPCTVPGLGRSS